ncbi:galactokinase family protein [Kocuria palustris]|uniref:galactokinase n=1 Tax=Kocuria palustris TaxID=71999 RepID=UPI0011A23D0B|nr:galactokinase family protein [Kocuria palustris]
MHHVRSENPGSVAPEWVPHPDHAAIARRGLENFEAVFGRRPEGIWQSPGRANLNGEHIDFLGGRCLPMALPYGTLVAAAPRTDGLLRMRTLEPSLDTGIVEVRTEDVGPGRPEGWTGYVAGALWGLHESAAVSGIRIPEGFGADMLIRSTLPVGGGLSSSAALECASILAFAGMITDSDDHDDDVRAVLAHACMMAEVKVVGASTGGLDQTASLRSHPGQVVSLDCRDFSITYRSAEALLAGRRLIAVDTRTPHWLGGDDFSSRRLDAEAAARFLGAGRLRDLLPETPAQEDVDAVLRRWEAAAPAAGQLDGRDPADAARRLRHALTEMLRSEQIDALLSGSVSDTSVPEAVGRILTAGHLSMRDDAEASFWAADLIVDTALAEGADGARLIGGGFGGSVLMLVPTARTEPIAAAVASAMAAAELPSPRFLDIVPSGPGGLVCRDCVELAALGCR